MQSITATISGKVKDGGEDFSESFTYSEPTTIEEATALVGGNLVEFVANVTSRIRENGVRNGLTNSKKGVSLADRFSALVKTYGASWVWSPRGSGAATLAAEISAAAASGDLDSIKRLAAELAAKYSK